MSDFLDAFARAFELIATLDDDLIEIVALSLRVSLTAVFFAAVIGLPLGALIGIRRFPGRRALIVASNALMGLPPVVVGLFLYLLLSRSGPLGVLGLLFTPTAMILAQLVLVLPIVTALTRQVIEDLHREYAELFASLDVGAANAVATLLWEARVRLAPVILAGFGRASAEVGAVMIVGGNIDHVTRVMTTTIALETSRGDLPLALGLGLLLIALNVAVNAVASLIQERSDREKASAPTGATA